MLVLVPCVQVTGFYDFQSAPKQALLLPLTAVALMAGWWHGPVVAANRWLNAALAAYVAGLAIAFAAAIDHRVALFGWYGYRLGVFSLLCGPALFVVGGLLTREGFRRRLLQAGAVGATAVVAVAFLQNVGASEYFTSTARAARNNGGVGTANDLAAFLVLGVAFAPAVASSSRPRVATAAYVAVLTFGTVLSESRAGFAVLAAALTGTAVLLALQRQPRFQARPIIAIAAGVALGVALALPTGTAGALVGRYRAPAGIEDVDALEVQTSAYLRTAFWEGGLNSFAARPFTGYGPDALPYVYGRHRNGPEFDLHIGKQLVGSSHNLFIDTGANLGIVTLAGLLGVIALTVGPRLRRLRGLEPAEVWILGGLGGHLVLLMLNPQSLPGLAAMWILAGTLHPARTLAVGSTTKRALRSMAAGVAAAAVLVAGLVGAAELRAKDALEFDHVGNYTRAAEEYSSASRLAPWERRYRAAEFIAVSQLATSGDRQRLDEAISIGAALHRDFEPIVSELLLRAALIKTADPTSTEVFRLAMQAEEIEPEHAYWRRRIEELAPLVPKATAR
jgi:hypothetical protein